MNYAKISWFHGDLINWSVPIKNHSALYSYISLLLNWDNFFPWNLYRNKYGDWKVHKFPGTTEAAEVYCTFIFHYLPHTFHQRVWVFGCTGVWWEMGPVQSPTVLVFKFEPSSELWWHCTEIRFTSRDFGRHIFQHFQRKI